MPVVPSGQLQITTPSGQLVQLSCPGQGAAQHQLCRRATQLVGEVFPSTRMRCRGQYYSLSGYLLINDRRQEVFYSWDCNTIVPLTELYQSVQQAALERLDSEAGLSDYRPRGMS